ncbi:MAG: isocitrate lyase/phosphoenolpyruvate mutase family protein [Pseudomonadota bacterium]
MDQQQLATSFRELHHADSPLVLYNIWDAATAIAATEAGATAIATGSHSVAGAHGYPDGEAIPLALLLTIAERIAVSTPLPLSIDFETGFAESRDVLAANTRRLIETGAVGINFEDQRIDSGSLRDTDAQCGRIDAVRQAARSAGIDLFINARTDVFLLTPQERHRQVVDDAIERGNRYCAAGADGLFVPGLSDPDAIGRVCERVDAPINVMMGAGTPEFTTLAELGVARISYGPGPFNNALRRFGESAAAIHGNSRLA